LGTEIKLILIPMIDMSQFNFELALPTKQNTYGYRWYSINNPRYSPIDLAVAGVNSKINCQNNFPIENLQTYFQQNKYRESESIIDLGILFPTEEEEVRQLQIKSITDWKYYCESSNQGKTVIKLLKTNAPLTFWEY